MNKDFPKPTRPFLGNVQLALTRGELWRAKEILQGTISSNPYEPFLYEQYGLVLLQMGDKVEAGKYLFLSRQDKKEYEESVTSYLSKYGRRNWQFLVSSFPRRARNIQVALFPDAVRAALEKAGIPPNQGAEIPAERLYDTPFRRFQDKLHLVGCGCVCLLLAMIVAAGGMFIFQVVSAWLVKL